jgi:hypothetical protein
MLQLNHDAVAGHFCFRRWNPSSAGVCNWFMHLGLYFQACSSRITTYTRLGTLRLQARWCACRSQASTRHHVNVGSRVASSLTSVGRARRERRLRGMHTLQPFPAFA